MMKAKRSRRRRSDQKHKYKIITGYILYAAEIRKDIIKKHPDKDFGFISKLVGIEWKNLPNETRGIYDYRALEQNSAEKEQFEVKQRAAAQAAADAAAIAEASKSDQQDLEASTAGEQTSEFGLNKLADAAAARAAHEQQEQHASSTPTNQPLQQPISAPPTLHYEPTNIMQRQHQLQTALGPPGLDSSSFYIMPHEQQLLASDTTSTYSGVQAQNSTSAANNNNSTNQDSSSNIHFDSNNNDCQQQQSITATTSPSPYLQAQNQQLCYSQQVASANAAAAAQQQLFLSSYGQAQSAADVASFHANAVNPNDALNQSVVSCLINRQQAIDVNSIYQQQQPLHMIQHQQQLDPHQTQTMVQYCANANCCYVPTTNQQNYPSVSNWPMCYSVAPSPSPISLPSTDPQQPAPHGASRRNNIIYRKPAMVRLRPKDAATQTDPIEKWDRFENNLDTSETNGIGQSKKPLKFSSKFIEYLNCNANNIKRRRSLSTDGHH